MMDATPPEVMKATERKKDSQILNSSKIVLRTFSLVMGSFVRILGL